VLRVLVRRYWLAVVVIAVAIILANVVPSVSKFKPPGTSTTSTVPAGIAPAQAPGAAGGTGPSEPKRATFVAEYGAVALPGWSGSAGTARRRGGRPGSGVFQ